MILSLVGFLAVVSKLLHVSSTISKLKKKKKKKKYYFFPVKLSRTDYLFNNKIIIIVIITILPFICGIFNSSLSPHVSLSFGQCGLNTGQNLQSNVG